MLEIRNKQKSPIQLIVRSKRTTNSFTTLIVPGVGKNNNVVVIEDERVTEYIERAEKQKLITTRKIPKRNRGE
jgi:hypothetical protein